MISPGLRIYASQNNMIFRMSANFFSNQVEMDLCTVYYLKITFNAII